MRKFPAGKIVTLSIFVVVSTVSAMQWPWDRDTPPPVKEPAKPAPAKITPTPVQPAATPIQGIRWPWLNVTPEPSAKINAKERAKAEASFKIPMRSTLSGADEVARFLAGMPLPKNSQLVPLTNDPAWQEHSAFFEKTFARMNMRRLLKLHNWETQYLP